LSQLSIASENCWRLVKAIILMSFDPNTTLADFGD
jgi:hypothetical protein